MPQIGPIAQPAAAGQPVSAAAASAPASAAVEPAKMPENQGASSAEKKTFGTFGSISVKSAMKTMRSERQARSERQMSVELTPETVALYWQRMQETLVNLPPRTLDYIKNNTSVELEGNILVVKTDLSFLEAEMKPHILSILNWLRTESGNADLNIEVRAEKVENEVVVYDMQDKYEAMLKDNPALAELRSLLPEIDL